jgi:N-acetylglucosaminyl-diphospho-decaprenol L-rhamnosyltransferase
MGTPDLSAVIISLNSRHFLEGCLKSLQEAVWEGYSHEVIVVDNGSTDGSQETVRTGFPWVRLIANETNVGFCAAANLGAEAALGRYVLHLNDDILILDDALPRLIRLLDANPQAAMAGSRLLNADGTDQFSSGRAFPTPMNAIFGRKSVLTRFFPGAKWSRAYLMPEKIRGTEPYDVDWLSAAAMVTRKDVYLQLGGLPEDFYYFVEILFCDLVKNAGHRILLDPQSKIIHYEGVGSGVRTRRVRRRHIVRFHMGAFRWYCLHRGWGKRNPLRYLVAGVLALRTGALLAVEQFRPERRAVEQMKEGRPEGGVAI